MLMLIWRVAQKCFSYRIFLVPSDNGIWAHHLGWDYMLFCSSEIVLHGNPSLHSLSTGRKSAKSVWTNGCPLLQWNWPSITLMVGVLCWREAQKNKGFLQLKHFPTMGRTSLQRALHWQWCAVSWATRVRCLVWAWGGLQMAFMTVFHFPVEEVSQSQVPRGPSLHGKEASLTVD